MTDNKNTYQIITDRIQELLDQDIIPWRSTWTSPSFSPKIITTLRPYRGLNIFLQNRRFLRNRRSESIRLLSRY